MTFFHRGFVIGQGVQISGEESGHVAQTTWVETATVAYLSVPMNFIHRAGALVCVERLALQVVSYG